MNDEFDLDKEPDLELLEGTSDDDVEDESVNNDVEDGEDGSVGNEEPSDEEKPVTKRDPVIPRARFDEVHSKWQQERAERERIEAELESLRKPKENTAPDETLDLKAMRKQAFDARLAGEDGEADEIEERIEVERDRRAEAAAEARALKREQEREARAAQESAAKQEAEAQIEAAKIVAKHTWLDSNSADRDDDAIEDVIALRNRYATKGMSLSAAMVKAVGVIAKARGESVDAPVVADKRKQLALVTAAETAASQPPRSGAGVGNRAVPVGNSILHSQAAWDKASDEERMQFLA